MRSKRLFLLAMVQAALAHGWGSLCAGPPSADTQAALPPKPGEQESRVATRLELRRWIKDKDRVAAEGRAIPADAVRVFVHEGTPASVRCSERHIAVDYAHSGVLFDRATGDVRRRFTAAEGWPRVRPDAFLPPTSPQALRRPGNRLVGPGVLNPDFGRRDYDPSGKKPLPAATVVEAEFAGRTWRAKQPAGFLLKISQRRPGGEVTWSQILRDLGAESYLEAAPTGGAPAKRYTTRDGLASNIVTHLAVADGALWAASVDIYDAASKQWGPGGLCRYDPKTDRWQRVATLDGRQVRWVTLLEAIGDELWVGFREGKAVAGDNVAFGMGLYPGFYRPKATAIVLARLASGKWTSFARPPRPEAPSPHRSDARAEPPTEYPVSVGRAGETAVLFTRSNAHQPSGNWEVGLAGGVSRLDLKAGQWRVFDPEKELDADQLADFSAAAHEVVVTSNRGAHRFDPRGDAWRLLDPKSDLRNSMFHSAAVAGSELWLGYGRQSFGVFGPQGISRYDERTARWTYMAPAELGTHSPVRRIVALENGQVWVLFCDLPWHGAAMRWTYYPRDRIPRPDGLGRFAEGKWTFPVDGMTKQDRTMYWHDGSGDDLAAVGNRLIYLHEGTGVYVGPSPWKKLCDNVHHIRSAPDDRAVDLVRVVRAASGGADRWLRARYDGANNGLKFEDFKADGVDLHFAAPDSLCNRWPSAGTNWVRVSLGKDRDWAVGDLGDGYPGHTTTVSPTAVWIFSPGEVIRLDRNWLEKQ